MEKNRTQYVAPALTVVDFKMERGFAASGMEGSRSNYSYDPNSNGDNGNNQQWL